MEQGYNLAKETGRDLEEGIACATAGLRRRFAARVWRDYYKHVDARRRYANPTDEGLIAQQRDRQIEEDSRRRENEERVRHQLLPPLWGAGNRHFGSLRPASLRRHMRSAAPFSPQFCTCAPTSERRCPLGSVHAGEQPHRSRSATVSRSERSAQATRPPLAALATDLIASSISRPSASKLSMMDIVDREADAERPRGG